MHRMPTKYDEFVKVMQAFEVFLEEEVQSSGYALVVQKAQIELDSLKRVLELLRGLLATCEHSTMSDLAKPTSETT